jgi:stage V sporulation protein R
MDLINQHTKRIMEGCKKRAREAGLKFQDETLEYIVTNKDLLELSPKAMIPTLYDYWVHDVDVLKEKGKYELYPHNPYETVINTRPAMSFYNDNNPDWLNVMIFYHVLAHIDFFQNNMLFKHTWDEDFAGRALSDKRLIAMLRSEKGRWLDYVIEFARGMDNLVGFYRVLSELNHPTETKSSKKVDFYFDVFLQNTRKVTVLDYLKEIDRYNDTVRRYGDMAEPLYFSDVMKRFPEFEALYERHRRVNHEGIKDVIQYVQEHSGFLNLEENKWMKSVIEIVRNTSLFFQPQIRTKILNEGWASYWHEHLFLKDDRIRGNEVGFARVNAKVTSLSRVGLNPYALGMRLFNFIEQTANKGKRSVEFQRLRNAKARNEFDKKTGQGSNVVFEVRENFSDFMFIHSFVDQDFVDQYRLFVAGRRLNSQKGVWEYYVKSRDAAEYKQMILDALYHPPHIEVDEGKMEQGCLFLNHHFEEKPLVREFIPNTMLGIEYLWGAPVKLETTEPIERTQEKLGNGNVNHGPFTSEKESPSEKEAQFKRVVYTMEKRQLSRVEL